jgi:hypothetical protein
MKTNFIVHMLHQLNLGLFKAGMRLVGHSVRNYDLRYEAYTKPFFGEL